MKKLSLFIFITVFVFIRINQAWADTTSPNLPGTAANVAIDGHPWNYPDRIKLDDGSYCTATLTQYQVSDFIQGTNYGFSIPAGATITGIEVTADCNCSLNTVNDNIVKLRITSGQVGDNRANATYWPPSTGNTKTWGGPSDTWGRTWSVAEINSSDFGVDISCINQNASTKYPNVDAIYITVYYSASTTLTVDPAYITLTAPTTEALVTPTVALTEVIPAIYQATAFATITNPDSVTISAAGFCISKTNNPPTLADTHFDDPTPVQVGSLIVALTSLDAGTTYHCCAYITVDGTTYYSDPTDFETHSVAGGGLSLNLQLKGNNVPMPELWK